MVQRNKTSTRTVFPAFAVAIRYSHSLLVGFLIPVLAAPAMGQGSTPAWPSRLRNDLGRLGHVEWLLREAAGNACPRQGADAGIVFDDRRAYDKRDWPLLETALDMHGLPVVAGTAPGGPADLAGLRNGDEVVAIGDSPVELIIERRKAGALAADALLAEIADAPPGNDLRIAVRRKGVPLALTMRPVIHCAIRLVLFTDRGVEAHSDSSNVAISTGMLAFARNDDELALAAGHELAHVINGDRRGGGLAARRRMEDAADELGLRLMECGGFARARGLSLFQRLGKNDWLGFLRAPTHRSWSDRVARLRAMPAGPRCPVGKA